MHPYKGMPDRQFWARAVSDGFDPDAVATVPFPLIAAGQKIMSAGSCFAATLLPHLERSGFHYVRTNARHPDFLTVGPENFDYDTYSAAYGNIYTARHLLQLVRRCQGGFRPVEDRWHDGDAIRDPFRPGLRYVARSEREFDVLTRQYLDSVLAAFRACDVFIFTLGLTEAWRSKVDGAIFPACPGTIAGAFDADRHEFVNFKVGDIVADLNGFASEVRRINPRIRLILTVSPVSMIATASGNHVLCANSYTKSALRAAAQEVADGDDGIVYFPSYEIVCGPQAPKEFFTEDRRRVSPAAIELVMSLFFSKCEMPDGSSRPASFARKPGSTAENRPMATLSSRFADLECEEEGQNA